MSDAPLTSEKPGFDLDSPLIPFRRLTIGLIVVIAVALRIAFFLDIGSGPLIWLHLWHEGDMNHFHRWAEQIAAGDWLSRNIDPPQHEWHREIAADYFKRHPEQLETLSTAGGAPGDAAAASTELWRRWAGRSAFWQDPLYAYLIAGTYAAISPDPRWVYLWQMVLGVGNVLLIYLLARRLFGDAAGVLAAVVALACGPLLIDELVLLRTTCVAFAGLMIAWLILRAMEAPHWGRWLTAGIATGAAVLLQSQFQVVAALTALCVLWFGRSAWRGALRNAVVFAGGVVLAMSPLMVRNLAVGLPPLTTPMSGTLALITATEYGAGAATWSHDHTAAILESSGGRLGPAFIAALRTHPCVASYLELLVDRLLITWHGYEQPNNHNFYQFLEYSGTLRVLPFTFAIIAPFALIGMFRGFARFRECWPLYALVAMGQLILLLLYAFARFRVPLVAAAIPFAAFGALSLIEWAMTARYVRLGVACTSVLAVGAWTFSSLPVPEPKIRYSDVANTFEVYYNPRIQAALDEENPDAAVIEMADALRHQPAAVTAVGDATTPQTDGTRELCRYYAVQYARLVELLQKLNQTSRATAAAHRAELLWQVGNAPSTEPPQEK